MDFPRNPTTDHNPFAPVVKSSGTDPRPGTVRGTWSSTALVSAVVTGTPDTDLQGILGCGTHRHIRLRSLFVWQPLTDQPRTHFSKTWCSSRLSPLGLRTATSGAGSDSSLCAWDWDLLGRGGFARRIPETQLRRQRFRLGFPVCRGCSRGSHCSSPHPEPASLVFVEGQELPEGVMWLRHDHGPHSGSERMGEGVRGGEVREPRG